ncbi:hypothetical protein N7G274_009659 [Stereocaulon virgatum]|uniref:WW domain-containing protein n=1 Tax=Stereocaulon virgatum TaxID=373712 RepID=A0ABR3ZZN1_9LECA
MGDAIKRVFRKREHRALPAYQYTPLELESAQIRLLTLLPGGRSTPVKIRLNIVELSLPFSEIESNSTPVGDVGSATTLSQPAHALSSNANVGNTPSYEALSYAWGPTTDPTIVTIVENSAKFSLQITQNLAIALPYLRHRLRPRVFWIDAICVNQQDSEERSRQVERMCDIYTRADRVVVWLGPETHDSGLALSTLHALSQEVESDWDHVSMKPVPGRHPHWADTAVALRYDDDNRTLRALDSLLLRPWHWRLWIWQEICLAKSSSIIQCGRSTLSWIIYCNALGCVRMKAWDTDLPSQDLNAFYEHVTNFYGLAYHSMQKSRYPLIWLFYPTRNSSCTDPKDRIYALRSLMHPSEAELIKPDYDKSTSQVYLETFIAITKHGATLNLLRYCNLRKKLPDCPTWVPNFNELAERKVLPFSAGGLSACEAQFVGKDKLCVAGRMVDVVKECLGSMPAAGSKLEVVRLLRHYVDAYDIGMDSQYVGGGSILEACCRLMNFDYFSDTVDYATKSPSFCEVIDAIRSVMIAQDFELALRSFHSYHLIGAVRGRKLVVTDAGYLGLVPEETKPGDVVCVLLGCDIPMLLRATYDGSHEVVGGTYVQGLMQSEALLGPIGEQWVIKVYNTNQGYLCQNFQDLETGQITAHDPRLGPLPNGWEFEYDQDAEFDLWFKDTHTGNITVRDPRLSSDALKKRGVELQTFTLV